MEDSVIVACHAPALSLLLYETARSVHDQRGLLIGEVFNEVISKKTDDNEINKEHKTVIYIKHCMPIPNRELLGNVGDINAEECLKITDSKKIVGWYSFRRNTRVLPNTLGEMLIHKALLEVIPGCKPEFFVAAFMTSNIVQSYSTHSYQHIFTRYNQNRDKFEPLKLKIYSLSDKSVNSSSKTSFPLSLRFHKIVGSFQKEENPVKSVLAVHDKVSELLSTFSSKLQQQENARSELESEIKQLKKQLGLDSKQDVIVEEEPEIEEFPKEKLIYFNPDKKYNSSRTSNPIKVSNVSPVPDDDEDDNEDVEILDEEDEKKPTAIATPASLRSYASVLDRNSPPAFNVKAPRMRPGLSPNVNAKKTPVPKKEVENIENQDIFESAEDMDENSEKFTTVNSQSSNQMETEQ